MTDPGDAISGLRRSPSFRTSLAVGVVLVVVAATVTVVLPTGLAHVVGVACSVVLGAVLCVAGAMKVADLGRWRSDSAALGVPWAAALPVPVVELTVGALLIVGIGWPIVPVLAALLLVVFSTVVIRELRHGRQPRCACFGTWSSKPLSGRTLIRNAGLIGLSVVSIVR